MAYYYNPWLRLAPYLATDGEELLARYEASIRPAVKKLVAVLHNNQVMPDNWCMKALRYIDQSGEPHDVQRKLLVILIDLILKAEKVNGRLRRTTREDMLSDELRRTYEELLRTSNAGRVFEDKVQYIWELLIVSSCQRLAFPDDGENWKKRTAATLVDAKYVAICTGLVCRILSDPMDTTDYEVDGFPDEYYVEVRT